MSRLTKYIEGTACIDGHESDGCCEVCETVDSCSQCPIGKIIDKLAHYEDLDEACRLIEVIRCRNCKRHENSSSTEGFGWCDEYECITADDGYCSRAVDKLEELKGGKQDA